MEALWPGSSGSSTSAAKVDASVARMTHRKHWNYYAGLRLDEHAQSDASTAHQDKLDGVQHTGVIVKDAMLEG